MQEEVLLKDIKKDNPLKIKVIKICGKEISVKQYLPVEDKLKLIGNVLGELSGNDYSFANPVQLEVFTILEIISAYTNIHFTEEEKRNPATLYDELEKQEIPNMIICAIPTTEYEFLIEGIEKTVSKYYKYKNSLRGIFEDISTSYKESDFDVKQLKEKLSNPDDLALLKDILSKMG